MGPDDLPDRRRPAPAARPRRPDRDRDRRGTRASTATRTTARRRSGRAGRRARPTCRSGCSPSGPPASARAACCWCCRAWTPPARAACCGTRSAWSTRRACGSPRSRRRPTRSARTTSCGGSRSALPGAGLHRRLRPLALRGRADRPGARAGAEPSEIERRYDAINEFEAELVDDGIVDRQVHAAHLAPTSSGRGCWPGSTTRPSTGSSTPATSTSARSGADYREAYEIALERTNTEVAPWHVVPATRSGTATSPSASCCSRRCAAWTRSGRPPTSTSRSSGAGWLDEEPPVA